MATSMSFGPVHGQLALIVAVARACPDTHNKQEIQGQVRRQAIEKADIYPWTLLLASHLRLLGLLITGNGSNTTSAGKRDTSDDAVSRTTCCNPLCARQRQQDDQGTASSDHRCKSQSRGCRVLILNSAKHPAQRNATGIATHWSRVYTSATSIAP
jgi:hypothetical protein